jgi:SAM-dependent methyltransferase
VTLPGAPEWPGGRRRAILRTVREPLQPPPIDDAYDRWSSTYDGEVNATRDLDARVLRGQRLDLDARDVLEIGCGTGKNTEWLARRARHVLGLDFSMGMLEKARLRLAEARNVSLLHQDLRTHWPAAAVSRDGVVGDLVLEHIEDLRPIFVEAHRVLRAGGWLFLAELHPYRQLHGSQAQFRPEEGTSTVLVPAFPHDMSAYVNAGLAAGFTLHEMREWRDDGAPPTALPRLLSLLWHKPV